MSGWYGVRNLLTYALVAVVGAVLVALSLMLLTTYNVTCGGELMMPGDECTETYHGILTTRSFEEERSTDLRTNLILLPIGLAMSVGGIWQVIAQARFQSRRTDEIAVPGPYAPHVTGYGYPYPAMWQQQGVRMHPQQGALPYPYQSGLTFTGVDQADGVRPRPPGPPPHQVGPVDPRHVRQATPHQVGPGVAHQPGSAHPHQSGPSAAAGVGPVHPHLSGSVHPHQSGPSAAAGVGPVHPDLSGPVHPDLSGPVHPHLSGPVHPHLSGPVHQHQFGPLTADCRLSRARQ